MGAARRRASSRAGSPAPLGCSRMPEPRVRVAFLTRVPSGAALGRELPRARVALLARSDRALPDLPRTLRARGFEVREVVAYSTLSRAEGDVALVRDVLADATRDVHVFASSPSA